LAFVCGDSKPTVCLWWSERLGGLSPAPLDLDRTSDGSLGPPPPSRYWGYSPTPLSLGFHMGEPKRNHLCWNYKTKFSIWLLRSSPRQVVRNIEGEKIDSSGGVVVVTRLIASSLKILLVNNILMLNFMHRISR